MTSVTPPGWYDDPLGSGQKRWWDGADWSDPPAEAPTVAHDTLVPPSVPTVSSPPPPGFPTDGQDHGVPPGGVTFAPPPVMRAVALDDSDHLGGRPPNTLLAVLGGFTLIASGALSWVMFRVDGFATTSSYSELFADQSFLRSTGPFAPMLGFAALVVSRHRISRNAATGTAHPLNAVGWMAMGLIIYTLIDVVRLRRSLADQSIDILGGPLSSFKDVDSLTILQGFIPGPGVAVAFAGVLMLFLAASRTTRP